MWEVRLISSIIEYADDTVNYHACLLAWYPSHRHENVHVCIRVIHDLDLLKSRASRLEAATSCMLPLDLSYFKARLWNSFGYAHTCCIQILSVAVLLFSFRPQWCSNAPRIHRQRIPLDLAPIHSLENFRSSKSYLRTGKYEQSSCVEARMPELNAKLRRGGKNRNKFRSLPDFLELPFDWWRRRSLVSW